MRTSPSRIRRRAAGRGLRWLGRSERGATTVEFALWMPVFFGLLMLVADVSILAYRYAEMWDVARTAARELALGTLPRSQTAVEAFVHARLTQDYAVTLVGEHTTFFTVGIAGTPTTMSVFGLFEAAVGEMNARVGLAQENLASG
jgi:Flp pilus assembly protein TadG